MSTVALKKKKLSAYNLKAKCIPHVYDDFSPATLRFGTKKDDGKNYRIFL